MSEKSKEIMAWVEIANEPTLRYLSDDDYIVDSLRHCSKCKTPKQMRLKIEDQTAIVGIPCTCRKQAQDEANRLIKEKQEKERRAQIKEKGLRNFEMINATFEKDVYPESQVSLALRRYIENWEEMRDENIGVLLYGSVGTGKTYYAGALANAVIEKGDRAFIMNVSDLTSLREIEEQRQIESRIDTWELFILDDLGAERLTEYATEKIYEAVDRRYSSGLPLVVTTNIDKEDMQKTSGVEGARKRIFDRVLASCPLAMRMTGQSKRREVADNRRDIARRIFAGNRDDQN